MNELEKVKEIFLAEDVDEETRKENEEQIMAWQQALVLNEAFNSWKNHDITKEILVKAKQSYKDISINLIRNRTLSETQRNAEWAKIDAISWLLSIIDQDAKGQLEQIQKEIHSAINAT